MMIMQQRLYAAKASGMLRHFLSLKLGYLIFSAAEQLSINLQAKDLTIQEAIKVLSSHFKSMRTEAKFNAFYTNVIHESSTLTEEPSLPRVRKLPRRLDDGSSAHVYDSPKNRYRHAYFEAIELASGEVENRFDQSDIRKIKDIESLLLHASNGISLESISEDVQNFLSGDIDLDRLKLNCLCSRMLLRPLP